MVVWKNKGSKKCSLLRDDNIMLDLFFVENRWELHWSGR